MDEFSYTGEMEFGSSIQDYLQKILKILWPVTEFVLDFWIGVDLFRPSIGVVGSNTDEPAGLTLLLF